MPSDTAATWEDLNRRAEALLAQGNLAAASDLWRRAATLPGIDPEQAGNAFLQWASTLRGLGRLDLAVAIYNQILRNYGGSKQAPLEFIAGLAACNKALTLGQAGKEVEALLVCNELLKRAGESGKAPLAPFIPELLLMKARLQRDLGQYEASVTAFDQFLSRSKARDWNGGLEQTAQALYEKGTVLLISNRPREALETYEQLKSEFGPIIDPAIGELVAEALVNMSGAQFQMGKISEAMALCEDILARYGNAQEPALQAQAAWALYNSGVVLDGLGRSAEAMVNYERVLAAFQDRPEWDFDEILAKTLYNRSGLLGREARWEEALVGYECILARLRLPNEPKRRFQVRLAILARAGTLLRLRRAEEAIATCTHFLETFARDDAPVLPDQIAQALYRRGLARLLQDSPEGWTLALEDFGGAEHRSDTDNLPAIRLGQTRALRRMGREAEAETRLCEALTLGDEAFKALTLSEAAREDPFLKDLLQRVEDRRSPPGGTEREARRND